MSSRNPAQPDQIDAFLVADKIQAANKLLRTCALDLGARFLADLIGQKPSTVQNQLIGTDADKRPSFDLSIALAATHGTFRGQLCHLICPQPDLTEGEALDEIEREVGPELGAHAAKKLRAIMRRTKRERQ